MAGSMARCFGSYRASRVTAGAAEFLRISEIDVEYHLTVGDTRQGDGVFGIFGVDQCREPARGIRGSLFRNRCARPTLTNGSERSNRLSTETQSQCYPTAAGTRASATDCRPTPAPQMPTEVPEGHPQRNCRAGVARCSRGHSGDRGSRALWGVVGCLKRWRVFHARLEAPSRGPVGKGLPTYGAGRVAGLGDRRGCKRGRGIRTGYSPMSSLPIENETRVAKVCVQAM
jgi:hypothetical protein